MRWYEMMAARHVRASRDGRTERLRLAIPRRSPDMHVRRFHRADRDDERERRVVVIEVGDRHLFDR